MKVRLKTALTAATLGVAAIGLTAGIGLTARPAQAQEEIFATWATGTCDAATGEWVVRWHLLNRARVSASISNVAAEPANTFLVGIPSEVASGAIAYGEQRVPGAGPGAHITYFAEWTDGTSGTSNGYFAPVGTCAKA
jgi:hypothetical protein